MGTGTIAASMASIWKCKVSLPAISWGWSFYKYWVHCWAVLSNSKIVRVLAISALSISTSKGYIDIFNFNQLLLPTTLTGVGDALWIAPFAARDWITWWGDPPPPYIFKIARVTCVLLAQFFLSTVFSRIPYQISRGFVESSRLFFAYLSIKAGILLNCGEIINNFFPSAENWYTARAPPFLTFAHYKSQKWGITSVYTIFQDEKPEMQTGGNRVDRNDR